MPNSQPAQGKRPEDGLRATPAQYWARPGTFGTFGRTVDGVTGSTLGSFLRPEGFERPRAAAVLREGLVLSEAGRFAARTVADRRAQAGTPYSARAAAR